MMSKVVVSMYHSCVCREFHSNQQHAAQTKGCLCNCARPYRDAFTDDDSKPALSYARVIAWSSGCQRMNRPSSTRGASCGQTL
jgi:hypothetical protein